MGTREAFRYMGLVAVGGGIAYKIIHILWLKKFDSVRFASFTFNEALNFYHDYFFPLRLTTTGMVLRMERQINFLLNRECEMLRRVCLKRDCR